MSTRANRLAAAAERATARALLEDEEGWLQWVRDYAHRAARPPWLTYHTRRSKGSDPGFPDLVAVRPGRLVVAELKVYPATQARGRPTERQAEWLAAFALVGAEIYVWRPPDRPEVERVLK
jgi:hypothetical protein